MSAAGKRFAEFRCDYTAPAVGGITRNTDSHNVLAGGKKVGRNQFTIKLPGNKNPDRINIQLFSSAKK
jgi:hypothetical protein